MTISLSLADALLFILLLYNIQMMIPLLVVIVHPFVLCRPRLNGLFMLITIWGHPMVLDMHIWWYWPLFCLLSPSPCFIIISIIIIPRPHLLTFIPKTLIAAPSCVNMSRFKDCFFTPYRNERGESLDHILLLFILSFRSRFIAFLRAQSNNLTSDHIDALQNCLN